MYFVIEMRDSCKCQCTILKAVQAVSFGVRVGRGVLYENTDAVCRQLKDDDVERNYARP